MNCFVVGIALVVFGFGVSAQAQLAWDPAQSQVLIVGLLKWQNKEAFAPFPVKNRRDLELVNFFRKTGVPSENLIYLQDKEATLVRIESSLKQLLKASRSGQTLIVYFEGHGYTGEGNSPVFFANYDAETDGIGGWEVREMVSQIDDGFKGDRVILMADCCHSGALGSAARKRGKRLSYLSFGSSLKNDVSTGNWTYTEALLSALKGEGPVDADHDGLVSVKEVQDYLHSEMAFAEEQEPVGSRTGAWKSTDILAVARPLGTFREGEHVEVYSEGEWWMARILEQKNGRYKVFYYGYEAEDEEWVSSQQMRTPKEKIAKIASALGLNFR